MVLEEDLQELKGGPVVRLLIPAPQHDVVDGARADNSSWAFRVRHPVTLVHLGQNVPDLDTCGRNKLID